MSYHSLPIVLLNLGGEMFYVLDQRLRAQKVPPDRAQKVLNEIATVMLNERFLEEIFRPQPIYNKQELYLLFRDIVHASIMKLNDLSMSKLYDLMVMVFKYQLYFASRSRDILLITLNHLDSLRNLVSSPQVYKQLDNAYYLLMKTYYPMSEDELQWIRYDLLNYFQDIHIKVSIFLRFGQQNNDGTFVSPLTEHVPNGIEVPGTIKMYNRDGTIKDVVTFPTPSEYTTLREKGVFDPKGNRVTKLGTSIYHDRSMLQDFSWSCEENLESHILKNMDGSGVYSSEIKTLMTQLLGEKTTDEEEEIPIDLFSVVSDISKEPSETEFSSVRTVNLNEDVVRQDIKLQNAAQEVNVDVENSSFNDLLYLLENTE